MKDLEKIKGAKMLNKLEQKEIKGGHFLKPIPCKTDGDCPHLFGCASGYCLHNP